MNLEETFWYVQWLQLQRRLCLSSSFMQGISMTHPIHRSPCKTWSQITKFDYRMKRYLLVMWIWNLHLDCFDDGWRIYIRASSWMTFLQMREPFLNRKGCSFWWGWFATSSDDLLLKQGDDHLKMSMPYCLQFAFVCSLDQDCF